MRRWSIILIHSQADIRRKARRTGHHGVLSKRKGQQIKYARHFGRREVDEAVTGDLVCSKMCVLCEYSCSIEILNMEKIHPFGEGYDVIFAKPSRMNH